MPAKIEVTVLDEHGDRWKVASGDPALAFVNKLRGLGFGQAVLPRRVLISGSLSDTPEAALTPDMPDREFVRAVRLNMCLAALRGSAIAPSTD